jgi:hypothetical protein
VIIGAVSLLQCLPRTVLKFITFCLIVTLISAASFFADGKLNTNKDNMTDSSDLKEKEPNVKGRTEVLEISGVGPK